MKNFINKKIFYIATILLVLIFIGKYQLDNDFFDKEQVQEGVTSEESLVENFGEKDKVGVSELEEKITHIFPGDIISEIETDDKNSQQYIVKINRNHGNYSPHSTKNYSEVGDQVLIELRDGVELPNFCKDCNPVFSTNYDSLNDLYTVTDIGFYLVDF